MKRCDSCDGRGVVRGIGHISHKCKVCAGTGKIIDDEEVEEVVAEDTLATDTASIKARVSVSRSEKMKEAWAKRKARESSNAEN